MTKREAFWFALKRAFLLTNAFVLAGCVIVGIIAGMMWLFQDKPALGGLVTAVVIMFGTFFAIIYDINTP